MLTMNPESDALTAEYLLRDFLSFDAPDGYRAELLDGEIVMSPPPDGNHESTIDQIVWQVFRNSSVEMSFSSTKGLIVPSDGSGSSGRVIPDITFAPRELDIFHGAPPWMDPSGVALVVEVTSSEPGRDREGKRRAYAGAGIPLYLLVDRKVQRVTLFSRPAGQDYRRLEPAKFGEKIGLPTPFDFPLDTALFTS